MKLTTICSHPQPGQWEKQQWDFLELRRIRMSGMPEGTLGRPGHVGTQERPDDRHQEQLGKSDAWKRSLANRLCTLLVLMSGSCRLLLWNRAIGSPQIGPIDIWSKVFATDDAVGGALDGYATFWWNWALSSNPLIDSGWSYSQRFSQNRLTTNVGAGFFDSVHSRISYSVANFWSSQATILACRNYSELFTLDHA